MHMRFDVHARRRLAGMIGVSEQYLYQCLRGDRSMECADAMQAELKTKRELRRWDVRTKDWHLIWPELLKRADHPEPPKPSSGAQPE